MHVTRLLRYGTLFTALFWLWLYVFVSIFPVWPPLIIIFYAGVLVILYVLTAIFFSQVEPTFWRGAVLGATLMLTVTILEAAPVAIENATVQLTAGYGLWYTLATSAKDFVSDSYMAIAVGTIIVGVIALLPSTAIIARRMASQVRSY